MVRSGWLVAPLALMIAAPVGAAADEPDPVDVMRRADEAIRGTRSLSYSATFEGVGSWASRSPRVQGTVRAVRTDGKDALGWRFVSTGELLGHRGPAAESAAAGIADPGQAATFRMAYDATALRSVREASKKVVEASPRDAEEVLGDGAGWIAGWLLRWDELVSGPFSEGEKTPMIAYEGMATVNGEPVHVIQVDYSERPGLQELDAWWYISPEDWLPRRLDAHYYGDAGDGFGVVTLSDLRTGIEVDSSEFTLATPEGFEVEQYKPAAPVREVAAPQFPKLLNVGDAAPDFALKDPTGKQRTLADYKGKVVVLDFWGTWCPPCVMAMPGLQGLHEQFKDKPVAIVGLNVNDPPGAAEAFMKKKGYTYDLLLEAEPVAQAFGVTGFPTFFVIGVDGKVIHRAVGFDPKGDEKIADVIEEHLAKRPG